MCPVTTSRPPCVSQPAGFLHLLATRTACIFPAAGRAGACDLFSLGGEREARNYHIGRSLGVKPGLSPSPAQLHRPRRVVQFNDLQASPPCSFSLSYWAWPLGDTRQHLVQVYICFLWSSLQQGDSQVEEGWVGKVIKILMKPSSFSRVAGAAVSEGWLLLPA